jgi:hypothetical protein
MVCSPKSQTTIKDFGALLPRSSIQQLILHSVSPANNLPHHPFPPNRLKEGISKSVINYWREFLKP